MLVILSKHTARLHLWQVFKANVANYRCGNLLCHAQSLDMVPQCQTRSRRVHLGTIWDATSIEIVGDRCDTRAEDSWWRQLMPYLASIIVMKLFVLLPLTLPHIAPALAQFGQVVLGFLSPSAQVVFVMAVFPLVMTVIQFCIVDQVIKSTISDEYQRLDDYQRVESDPGAVPRSPLLEAGGERDYGSTSPGPSLFKVDSEQEHRGLWRSGAPSPDSVRPLDFPSPVPNVLHESRPSADSPREARRSLSPTEQRAIAMNVLGVLGMEPRA